MSDFKPVNQPIAPASADPGEEFPFLHTITVVDRVVSVDKPELVQNNIRTETVTLNLDSEWDGLSCIINIGNDDTPVSLIWSGQPVIIPAELMTDIGTLNVSVVGYGESGTVRAVTKKADAMFVVAASGYVEDDNPVPDPTTILGQLVEAADKANQAAQNAEDSTIDKVNVTMLPTGSSASGSVADKTLSLRIPNGPEGPQGPKGDPGDLTTVAHDATLTGNGTRGNPLGVNKFTELEDNIDFNNVRTFGIFMKAWGRRATNTPILNTDTQYFLLVNASGSEETSDVSQIIIPMSGEGTGEIYFRYYSRGGKWGEWKRLITSNDLSNYVPLSTYQNLETKVEALEAKTTYKQIDNETDLHTLFKTNGIYIKQWGNTVVNAPTSTTNGTDSMYGITVIGEGENGYMRIEPMAGFADSYFCQKTSGTVRPWYKITSNKITV